MNPADAVASAPPGTSRDNDPAEFIHRMRTMLPVNPPKPGQLPVLTMLGVLPQQQIDDIVLKTGKLLADNFPSNAAFTAHTARGKIRKMLVQDIQFDISTEVFDELVARTVQVPPIYGIVSLPPLKKGGKPRYRVNPGYTDRKHNSVKNDTMSSVISTIEEKSRNRIASVDEIVVEGHQSQMVRTSIDVLLAVGVVDVLEVNHRIKFKWNDAQAEAVKSAPETIERYYELYQEVESLKEKIAELRSKSKPEDGKV